MTRETTAAFSALTRLDPLRATRPDDGDRHPDPADTHLEMEIARILAVPRGDAVSSRQTGARPWPVTRPATRTRSRYGVLGLAASAALAVIATLLWVSPSAGQPIGHAGAVQTGVSHHEVAPASTDTTPFIR